MKCPECSAEIEKVVVISHCWQFGYLNKGTNKIVEYDSPETIDSTVDIECPECNSSLLDFVFET